MKTIVTLSILLLVRITTWCQIDYTELPDPHPVNASSWKNLPTDMVIGFGSIDIRYPKTSAPDIQHIEPQWSTTAWKGERVHTQLLISTRVAINNLQIITSELKDSKGNVIPASVVTTGFVRYVLTDGLNKEGHGCGIPPAASWDSSLVADGIDFISRKNVAANTTQPVWVSIAIPQNTAAGNYSGLLKIQTNGSTRNIPYNIEVKPFLLPPPSQWSFHLDLWQNPYAVARVYGVKEWSKEHFEKLRPYMQMLANAGQKTITVSMIHDPWRGQTYDIYKSMIRWIKKKDNTWSYDYSVFDQWVSFMQSIGIDKLINCYTMVPWNNKFYYFDEALQRDTVLIAKNGTPEYEAHWRPMLTSFVQHLKQKGWYNKTAIAMDERPLEDMQKVIQLIRSVDKDIKISLAGSFHREIASDLYDYCIASAENFDSVALHKRMEAGLPTTFYTYCYEGHPNTFTFSPPAESAWLGWYAANKQFNGYLRWAFNCWPHNPMQDSRYNTWSAGDTYLVYPGGSSIRFERLIEGIQDYEKIQIIKAKYKNDTASLRPLLNVIQKFETAALNNESAAEQLQKAKAVLNQYTGHDPATNSFPVIEGQAWPAEVKESYDRFPARAEKTLNPNVWNISHSSAGLYIKFKTNATTISVRYVVKGALSMTHMPATGVSGIDLYAIDPNGRWKWAPSTRSFADTIEYRFSNIIVSSEFPGRDYEYRLYLPLYNTVAWLNIDVPASSSFAFLPLSPEKPIVVYGTSIAQGACASRPGMAWTALLQQQLDRPLINLGFSGSGQLEPSVIALMTDIDAKLYVLDCIPNLTGRAGFARQELEKRILASVQTLKEKRPAIPILLVDHSGGTNNGICDTAAQNDYENANDVLHHCFEKMKASGVTGIYLLKNTDIGLSMDATVDGLHPNDIGMMEYARAYEKVIRVILNEPVGEVSTAVPVVQSRDGYYNWKSRHSEILSMNKTKPARIVFLGNSIIHYWGGFPTAPLTRGADSWNEYLEPLGVRNFAFGWDRIENVLWRVYHDELDGFKAAQVWVMIGTNNIAINDDPAIITGLKMLVEAIKVRQPGAAIVLSGILPRRETENRIVILNGQIADLAKKMNVQYVNPGTVLLNVQHKIDESLFTDGLHPNTTGYKKLALAIKPYLK